MHRIGQTRAVDVIRLTTPLTVEDRILALSESKRAAAATALGDVDDEGSGDERRAVARLNEGELRDLFGFSN